MWDRGKTVEISWEKKSTEVYFIHREPQLAEEVSKLERAEGLVGI